ncbi:polyphosphate kinase 2 family protein [Sphingoaurantiacus capsulatus]|uniref:Polyphosphate kinase 2 family protein n=1 Tax=Sphingoaurantiacus capsulatus TaxID=1771310 RepID=A0ABV7XFF9_9SPHN
MINLSDHEAGRPFSGDYDEALAAAQKRLVHAQVAHIVHQSSAVIVFEGWDASGKGGAIRRLTGTMDPHYVTVWPTSAPTEEEADHHFLWRFWQKLPARGHLAVFDRSWYGRVLVERVEKFTAKRDWRRAYDEINAFEAQLAAHGTAVIKIFLHVTQAEQDDRLTKRLDHPWKRWKIQPDDFRNRARRKDYLAAMHDMFAQTNTAVAPWAVFDGNDKHAARIAVLNHVADLLAAHVPPEPPPADPRLIRAAKKAFGYKPKGD